MKKKCLKVFSATFALCLAFGVGNLLTASADGDEVVYVDGGVAKVGFYVQNGAAVHLGDSTTGIKYTTVVTKAFQDYLTSEYEGASFEWHTLITGTNMLEGGDVTKVTPELTKPEWVGENAGNPACENFTQTLENMVDNEETGEIADVDKDGEIDQKYAAAITYQNLLDDQKVSASNADLIARSYVKITVGEEETIIYSAAEDTVRNMKAVAYAAIKSGKYTASEDNLYGYTGVTSEDVVTNETVDSFYSLKDKSGAITVDGLTGTTCEAYYGAKKLTSSVSNGVVTVSGINGLEAGEDKEYELTVFANGKIYDQAFGCATQVIDEAKDLDVFCLDETDYSAYVTAKKNPDVKVVDGYYVLAGNIDASSYAMKTQGFINNEADVKNGGFKGVFDGRGYAINDITFGYDLKLDRYTRDEDGKSTTTDNGTRTYWNKNNYSLFGVINSGATVKNFALTGVDFDLTNTGDYGLYMPICAPIAQWIRTGATVENVFVSTNGAKVVTGGYNNNNNTTVSGFAYRVDTNAILKNVIVDATYESDGKLYNDMSENEWVSSFAFEKGANNTSTDNKWTNVVVISSYKLATRTKSYTTFDASNIKLDWDIYNVTDTAVRYNVNMENTYRYESVDAWKTAQEDPNVTTKPTVSGKDGFSTNYWHFVDGVPVWGKATA